MGESQTGQQSASGWPGYRRFPEALLERALEGDGEAEERLWAWVLGFCYHAARALCRRQGLRSDLVDDVVQDAMHGLIHLRYPVRKLEGARDRLAYLYTVVRNSVHTQGRRLRRRQPEKVSLDQLRDPDDDRPWTLAELFAHGDDPAADAELAELHDFVEAQLDDLPKETAEVFRLHIQGLTQREIADRTGTKFGTVATWVHRTRKRLDQAWRRRQATRGDP
ncbi:MAG: RNA polymerase sigma factor [bacterium]